MPQCKSRTSKVPTFLLPLNLSGSTEVLPPKQNIRSKSTLNADNCECYIIISHINGLWILMH